MSASLLESLADIDRSVTAYILQPRFRKLFRPDDLRDAVFAYLERPGKKLRPAVLLWSCGAVGGRIDTALPAAAGVELFHTWTLVHDDVIDNDDLRRGGPTVHKLGQTLASEKLGYSLHDSIDYGRNLAILAGDALHGWNASLFCDCARESDVSPEVVLEVIRRLESYVVSTLLEGEMLDIQFSRTPIEYLSCEQILQMLWMKTGVLYEFAAQAGAMIGLGVRDPQHPYVAALSSFAGRCGTAFQLQDDILGVVADESKLGKPVGSDLREGKKTIVIYHALRSASEKDRRLLLSVLGRADASSRDIEKAIAVIKSLGAIDASARIALDHIEAAIPELEAIPDSPYKKLLEDWARFMVERKF